MATVTPTVFDPSQLLVPPSPDVASCPLCHTAVSSASALFAWQCRTCGQHWTPLRLATVASYDERLASAGRPLGEGNAMTAPTNDDRRSNQERLDATYQSNTRGEHRYESGLTTQEVDAREARDGLKARLRGVARRPQSRS